VNPVDIALLLILLGIVNCDSIDYPMWVGASLPSPRVLTALDALNHVGLGIHFTPYAPDHQYIFQGVFPVQAPTGTYPLLILPLNDMSALPDCHMPIYI
jgi:hypothetical protein